MWTNRSRSPRAASALLHAAETANLCRDTAARGHDAGTRSRELRITGFVVSTLSISCHHISASFSCCRRPPHLVAVAEADPPSTTKRKHLYCSFPVFKPSQPQTSSSLDCFLSTTHTLQIVQTWASGRLQFAKHPLNSCPKLLNSSHTDITSNSPQPPPPSTLTHVAATRRPRL